MVAGIIIMAAGAAVTFSSGFTVKKLFPGEDPKTSIKGVIIKIIGFVIAAVGLVVLTQS